MGNFTHWHAGCYDETLGKEDKEQQIATEATDFLTELFNDKIVMRGSHQEGGGFYHIDFDKNEQDAPFDYEDVKQYVWSGKAIS